MTVWKRDLAGNGVDLAPKFRVAGVTFDFWETLFMDTPELDRRRDELRCQGLREDLAKLGVDVSIEELADGFKQSTTWLADIWKRGEQVSTLEQIRYIVNRATRNQAILPTDLGALMRLEESYWSPSLTAPATLNAEAPEVFRQLRERGLKIGLICNTGRGPGHALRELMRREGVLDYFVPSDILHVGDNIENDVRGAQSAGMKTLLFDYEVPLGFREQPSLLALTRASDSDTGIRPDGRIKSLSELLNFIH